MSSSQYNYDEDGETWPYFVLTLLAVVLVPYTYTTVKSLLFSEKDATKRAHAIEVDYTPANAAQIRSFRVATQAKKLLSTRLLVLAVGWGLFAYLVLILKENTHTNAFDPYAILEVSLSATEKEVKSRYRKLSLKFHPDKIANDVSAEVKQSMEEMFIKINQAYKALTDEDTKKNYELYGHPDGPQERLMGIALPKFLIEGAYSPLLVVLYFIVIVGVLPYVVGRWWTNVQMYTKKGIHVETATFFVTKFVNLNPANMVTPFTIIEWLSYATEFKLQCPDLTPKQIEQHILDHLYRRVTADERSKLEIVSILPTLINALLDISATFRNSEISLLLIDLNRYITQALVPGGRYAQLLQLPYVDPKVVTSQSVKTLGKLLTLSEEKIGEALGIKDAAQLKTAIQVASEIPLLKIVDAKFTVPGETVVTSNSTAYLEMRVLVKSAKHTFKGGKLPVLKKEKLASMDAEAAKFENLKDPMSLADQQPELPAAYAPWFPQAVSSGWMVCPLLQSDAKLAEPPTFVNKLDLSNLELTSEEITTADNEKLQVGLIKVKLIAPTPGTTGQFQFRIIVKNIAYFGADLDFPIIMTVEEPPAEYIEEKIYEIEDPDEDSLAGAMASFRGERVKRVESSDDSDESDFDDDKNDGSDFTDINTDTEDEK